MQSAKAIAELNHLEHLGSPMRLAACGWQEEWQTLIAILMSARTRDEVTIAVGERLFLRYPTLPKLARAKSDDVANIVRPINFYRNKTKAILGCARELVYRFHSNLPRSIDELVTLPGVGRKTANIFLAQQGEKAIGVDTHVAYIARFLGWTLESNPRKIENDLEALFPRRYWRNINSVCVCFGKTYTSKRLKDEKLSYVKSYKT